MSKRNGSVSVPPSTSVEGSCVYSDDLTSRLKAAFLQELCMRPCAGLTEVRRDGKDNAAIAKVIKKEFDRCSETMDQMEFVYHMKTYATASWVRSMYISVLIYLVFLFITYLNSQVKIFYSYPGYNGITSSTIFGRRDARKRTTAFGS